MQKEFKSMKPTFKEATKKLIHICNFRKSFSLISKSKSKSNIKFVEPEHKAFTEAEQKFPETTTKVQ
jgi:hypothetical protein